MKRLPILFFLLLPLLSVSQTELERALKDTLPTVSNGAEESHEISAKDNSNAHIFIRKHQINTVLESVCTRKVNVEVVGLYPDVHETPDVLMEKLYLKESLIEEGFSVVNSSRGNWLNGPRLVEVILKKADCECRIFKKYWSVESDSTTYTITEQLICNDLEKEINFYYPE